MQTEINVHSQLTHMPFLLYDRDGRRILFYAVSDDCEQHCWKLHYSIDNGEPQRLETGLPHGSIECSPTAWQDESGWHVSFVGQLAAGPQSPSAPESTAPAGRLYRMDGTDLEHLSAPISLRIARTGFVYKDRIAVGEIQDVVHVHDTGGDQKIEIPGAFIYRVSYRADSPNKILISGDWIGEQGDPFTLEYDLDTEKQRYIECDGLPAYKCTIYGDEILYAERTGEHFEHRRIRRGERVNKIPAKIAQRQRDEMSDVLIKTTKRCGCRRSEKEKRADSVRPSCLECVEKHLGAAFVILSEIASGYSYRLRFVGHLHEAEDESQDFLQLYDMIREARKAYQKGGIIPDWEILGKAVEEAKHVG